MTLDVIGLAGFNYEFNALKADEKPNELNLAFKTIFQGDTEIPIFNMLRLFIPPLRVIVSLYRLILNRSHLDLSCFVTAHEPLS